SQNKMKALSIKRYISIEFICLFIGILFFNIPVFSQSFYLYGDKTFGGNKSERWGFIDNSNGYNFIICGESSTYINGDKTVPLCDTTQPNSDIWLFESDTAFNIQWQTNIGSTKYDYFPSAKKLSNGNIFFGCHTNSPDTCDKSEPVFGSPVKMDYWVGVCNSSGVINWNKSIGGGGNERLPKMLELPNQNILICGISNSSIGDEKSVGVIGQDDYWCLLIDSLGNKIWDNVYGGLSLEYSSEFYNQRLINSGDGNIFLIGTTNSSLTGNVSDTSNGGNDIWVVKMDYSGNIIWDKLYGGALGDGSNSSYLTDDNGLIICGTTGSPISGDVSENPKGASDFWLLKLDSLGNKQWDKRYGGTNFSRGMWVRPSLDGGYWVAGTTDSDSLYDVSQPGYGQEDYWVIKVDSVGNKLWDKRFGSSGQDWLWNFIILPDTSVMLYGEADYGTSDVKTDIGKGLRDFWLIHFKYGSLPTGMPIIGEIQHVRVYPNPSTGSVNIPKELLNSKLNILDIAGRVVFHQQGLTSTELHFDSLPKGCYIMQFSSSKGIYNARWVKM
ncbi:MAG: T9SS type A sorting domain-containing protein, partial [Bacteroidota bacterium]